jgi:hypothetical protein
MDRRALLAWLLELIRNGSAPEGDPTDPRERFEAIEVTFRGKRFLIRVDEVAD